MSDLNLEQWVIKIEDVTEQRLTSLLQKLIGQQSRYRTHLAEQLPPYVQQASKTADLLAKGYIAATKDG